ncbi:MAG: TonB-dependent receptor [Sphingopyxis sp.]|uniref:TonB-dependent receptor domain-containing protein n=1 Tax=Sphingopyxis sp. TaxID=1908224 RepID=UPI002ABACD98|nr:TonB-dependent receptor [Sphingopyxis sp.]MDZ3831881.1 TonB-dependent receptor [Sphingopyxis sp.]
MTNSRKAALLLGVSTCFLAGQAYAQQSDESVIARDASELANQNEANDGGDIIVTGTRFQNPNLTAVNPVTTVDADALRRTGRMRLEEALERVPALSQTEQRDRFSLGATSLNLRGLGAERTLTLVNGRRFVPGGSGSSSIDVNAIPQALIERVDVLTGGASAVYGADAVTGVVNFILKDDFDGVSVTARYGAAVDKWDAQQARVSVLVGNNFADGRGNFTLSYTYANSQMLRGEDRSFTSDGAYFLTNNPAGAGATPRRIYLRGGTDGSVNGAIVDGNRVYTPFGMNGDGTLFDPSDPNQAQPLWQRFYRALTPKTNSHSMSASARYEISSAFEPFVNLYYSWNTGASEGIASETIRRTLARDNAFITPALRAAYSAVAGNASLNYNRVENDRPHYRDRSAHTFQGILGVKGDLSPSLRYELSANIGRNNIRTHITQIAGDRYRAAIDAVFDGGKIVCRSNLNPAAARGVSFTPGPNSGCVPFNPFTRDPAVNGAALDWIYQPGIAHTQVKQTVLNGFVEGSLAPLGLTLPGGEIEFVLGGEYRKESLGTRVNMFADEALRIGHRTIGYNTYQDPLSISASEVFGEVALPILADAGPLMHELTLSGAFRYSDYNPTGGNWTYNAGAAWAPFPDLKFRGSYARAVRSPTLGELFSPQSGGNFPIVADPCSASQRDLGSSTRAANCTALLTAAGVANPGAFEPGLYFPDRTFGGNPDLDPEVGDTFTVGLVATPSFIPRLTLTVDYYNIKLSNTIGAVSPEFVMQECVDLSDTDNRWCALAPRGPSGEVTAVTTLDMNVGTMRTSGYELALNYAFPAASWGTLSANIRANYLDKLDIQTTTRADSISDEAGLAGSDFSFIKGATSRWSVNAELLLTGDRFSTGLGLNYRSRTLRLQGGNALRDRAAELEEAPYLGEAWNVTWSASYNVTDRARLFMGMDNLLNKKPDIGESFRPYSPVGRSVYFGFDFSL